MAFSFRITGIAGFHGKDGGSVFDRVDSLMQAVSKWVRSPGLKEAYCLYTFTR
ncbi:MAG: hypothetical protein ABSC04_15490 [Syntrophobacteraceae bacterium]